MRGNASTPGGHLGFPRATLPAAPEPDGTRTGCIRFPPNGFAFSLTLFSKYFSPFPHGTCLLSVSCQYLALDGVYHQLWAAFPNNPTLRVQLTVLASSATHGVLTLSDVPFQANFGIGTKTKLPLSATIRRHHCRRFHARAVPASLAVTGGIPVGFFSSAYLYA